MKNLGMLLVMVTFAGCLHAAENKGGKGGGGGDDAAKLAFKATAAGFFSESIEHVMRRLVQLDAPQLKEEVKSIEANRTSATNIDVTVVFNAAPTMNYACLMVDDFSKSGTVLKKEVLCTLR